jgi:hypothetical protein
MLLLLAGCGGRVSLSSPIRALETVEGQARSRKRRRPDSFFVGELAFPEDPMVHVSGGSSHALRCQSRGEWRRPSLETYCLR